MASNNVRFTALGMSGSGKTCYVLGMYYHMITGYKGFSLKADGDSVSRLEDWMDNLDVAQSGNDRFPAGTALHEVSDYQFKLKYALKDIMTFNWMDYGGGTLKARENNPEVYNALNQSIEMSTALYIFLDGELLCSDDVDHSIRKLRSSVRTMNAYLQEFADNHQKEMPPIVFVITKGDLCSEYLSNDVILRIMHSCFDMLMKEVRCYVTVVSLGQDIAEDDYTGDVDPINMHLPFFIGIYHNFLNYCIAIKNEIMEEERRNQSAISQNQSEISSIRNRGWLGRLINGNDVSNQLQNINRAEATIRTNRDLLAYYKKLMNAVSSQLMRDSKDFIMIEDGVERDFDASESFNL